MSHEIIGSNGAYWSCHQAAWPDYLQLATAFGWAPEGAFLKNDELGFRPHPSGSYIGNDRQLVGDEDARAFGAALNLAIATINAGEPITDDQVMALKEFKSEVDESDEALAGVTPRPGFEIRLTEQQRAGYLKLRQDYLAAHPAEIRTIRTPNGTFEVNLRMVLDLAELVGAGGFMIA